MSSIKKGLRRVGIVGLSTLVAASMMTLSAASSFAVAGDFAHSARRDAGATSQPHGSLTLDFANDFTTNATQTFTITGIRTHATTAGNARGGNRVLGGSPLRR